MHTNFLVVLASGLIPLFVGFIWYSKHGVGGVWMKESGYDPATAKPQNMVVLFGLSVLLSLMLAGGLLPAVIHQMGLNSMLMGEPALKDPSSELSQVFGSLMSKYGSNYRTFKHGAFHGLLTALFVVLPTMGTSALFEQKSWKYVAVHVGYWAICMALMGGVIGAFA
jgi:hypothetical protein